MNNNLKFERLSDNISKNSYDDWNLLLAPYTLEAPQPQTNFVSIPGRDGSLDFTESLGTVRYNNRNITLNFTHRGNINNIFLIHGEIANFLHGQKLKIILPNDIDFYYIGRAEISSLDRAKRTNQISISVNCQPYKLKNYKTIINDIIGTLPYTITINNLKMQTMPTIITTENVIMNFENTVYSFEGTYRNTSVVLKEGENIFTFKSGSGDVSFEYQEGSL